VRFFIQWPVLTATGRLRIHQRLPLALSPLLCLGRPLGAMAVGGLLLHRPWILRINGRQPALLLLKLLSRVAIRRRLLLLLCRVTVSGLLLLRRMAVSRLLLLRRIAVSGLLLLRRIGLLLGRRILSLPLRRRDLDRDSLSWDSIPRLCFKPVILGTSTATAHGDND
jgi:hypothetical protein